MSTFKAADILLPQEGKMESWAVIACDQYTSQPEYWQRVRKNVGEQVSTLNLILPEAEMDSMDGAIDKINNTMKTYMDTNVFKKYENVFIYVERTLNNGIIRKGVVGVIDLEDYDYRESATSKIRATEKTIEERIPPRMNIRRNASIELPHILLLCDDEQHMLLESLENIKEECSLVYDFDLMEKGGHISGWLIEGKDVDMFNEKLDQYTKYIESKYEKDNLAPMVYAMGDGNHSLATAKACYEELKRLNPDKDLSNHPARYALLELENIHDDSQEFEAIHRIITDVDADALISDINSICSENGHKIEMCVNGEKKEIFLNKELGEMPIVILQKYLDEYLSKNTGDIDFIHGEDVVVELSKKDNSVGFILPVIEKNQFFKGIVMDGVLPRKTFSMGSANEKRYYLEARSIV